MTTVEAQQQENTLVGQVVGGRYHVKRVLGEGGMGIVYEAEQQMGTATRKVALKTLHAHLSHDPSVSARFHREVGTIAQLEHPNTIKVYDFGATADGTLYIAMEFVAGKSLSQLLEESKTLAPQRVLHIVHQIAGSLEEAHQQGVIHRDLKPDNVVLTQRAGEKDVVKLLDFGIAARTESADAAREQKLTQQGMVLGTPPYMSPEQFTGKPLDARSDIYSLAVMTYEMLAGTLPFQADTPWQWATEHMTAQPKPFEASPVAAQIPAPMRAAVLRALAKNKEDRQASVTQFYEELAGAGPAVAPNAHSGTAYMAAPPVFDAPGPAKTAAMPSPIASGPSTAQAVAAAVPIPERRQSGNKGLVIGLASVGGVLLIGMAVVGVRSMKPAADDSPPPQQAAPPPAVTVTSQPADTATSQTATANAEPAAETTPTPAHESHEATTHATAAHATTGATNVAKPPATSEKPPATSEKPPAGNQCAACISAAGSGNLVAAASAYRSCTDAAQKSQCAGMAKSRAESAVQTAAFNGSCPQAKAIAAAAESMGVPSGNFKRILSQAKCN
ncbi:MAG TPA: protein kinase [Polyangiaceae bacterium]|nr:protein kinase [Polyangiaceae bacterium]